MAALGLIVRSQYVFTFQYNFYLISSNDVHTLRRHCLSNIEKNNIKHWMWHKLIYSLKFLICKSVQQ